MTEIELHGQSYRIGKLDAFKQFHVSRKIAPMVPTLIPIFVEISSNADIFGDIDRLSTALLPFADAVAGMKDEDAEYVISTCLSSVQRKSGTAWAKVWNDQANACMFDDLDLSTMLPLVVHSIKENLGSFISGLLTAQASTEAQA